MSNEKTARLLNLLISKTAAREMGWVPTDKRDVFQADFPRYSVRIFSVPTDYEERDFVLQLINDEGIIVESITDPQLQPYMENAFIKMQDLHESARRIAMGVEQALDDIIEYLDPDIPF